jgi:hypothetical protein
MGRARDPVRLDASNELGRMALKGDEMTTGDLVRVDRQSHSGDASLPGRAGHRNLAQNLTRR